MYALSGLLLRTLMCGKIYQILLNLATSRENRDTYPGKRFSLLQCRRQLIPAWKYKDYPMRGLIENCIIVA